MPGRVVVVGSVNVDFVARLPRLPAPGETVTGGTFERHHGGKGANQAVASARLGASTFFVGCVGDDDLGRGARAQLAAERVDVATLRSAPGAATGVAAILVDAAGGNLIGVAPGANLLLTASETTAALEELALTPRDVVLVSNEIAAEAVGAALAAAHAAGTLAVFNPAPADGFDMALLASVDILTPNRSELAALTGGDAASDPASAASVLLAANDRVGVRDGVVVTLGASGALILTRDSAGAGVARRVPAPVLAAVDTTGAGDAFNGCLAASLAAGRSLDEAVDRAVTAGALATLRVGARTGLSTAQELEEALQH